MFTRYLDNSASGFAFYSGQDQHTTYAYRPGGLPLHRERPRQSVRRHSGRRPGHDAGPGEGARRQRRARLHGGRRGPAGADHRTASRPASRRRAASDLTDPLDPLRTEVRLRHEGGARRAAPGLRREQRLRRLRARRQRRHLREVRVELRGLRQRPPRRCLQRRRQGRSPMDERRRPRDYATVTTDRYRFRYDGRWLHDRHPHLSRTAAAPTAPTCRPLEGARVPAGPSSETPCCGYEEEDTELGRLEHAARRARRPGARDPRDVGRRLGHERDPARDLLPPRDAPEVVAARARDPAARRHLRPVGLQRRAS